ncbi:hypothetical protein D3C84_961860 [compost metagenome]
MCCNCSRAKCQEQQDTYDEAPSTSFHLVEPHREEQQRNKRERHFPHWPDLGEPATSRFPAVVELELPLGTLALRCNAQGAVTIRQTHKYF